MPTHPPAALVSGCRLGQHILCNRIKMKVYGHLQVRVAPLALELEQLHLIGLIGTATAALEPFSAVHLDKLR